MEGYFYDGQGSRVIKVTGGVETRYYFGAGEYVSSAWSGAPLSADMFGIRTPLHPHCRHRPASM